MLVGRFASVHLHSFTLPSLGTSLPRKDGDLASLGQRVNDLSLIVSIMDPRLTELSGITVLLPVVMPISSAVCAKAEYIHLYK